MSASTTSTTSTAYAQARRRQRGGGGDRDAMGNSTSGVEAKVVVMGSAGVGKTSLVQRYTTNTFSSTKIAATAGASFHVKKTIVNGVPVRLQLWDTAGQERFRSLAPMYYRGAHAAVLVYDITNPSSFEDIRVWLEELKKNIPPESENDMIIYIVGTKVDLAPKQRKVTPQRVFDALVEWFPPPKPPTPPPQISNALVPYYGPTYSFGQSSSIYFPPQLSSLSTSVSTHLPTLPSFNLGLPSLDQIRPRFSSLTSARPAGKLDRPGESPTGTDSTGVATTTTTATASSAVTAGTSSSSFMPAPIASPTGSRFAMPRSTTTSAVPSMSNLGLNVNMTGSTYNSGFTRAANGNTGNSDPSAGPPTSSSSFHDKKTPPILVEFPSSANSEAPSLVRRNTAGPGPSISAGGTPSSTPAGAVGMRSSRSMSSRPPPAANLQARSKLTSCMSDDEDAQRGRERRPIAYRRFNEVEQVGPRRYGGHGGESSSGDELDRTKDQRSSASRLKKEREKEREERRKKEEADRAALLGQDDDDSDDEDIRPWGFSKELEVREVSALDGRGVEDLFGSLLEAIIKRRDFIETERRLRERNSVMLNVPTSVPTWGTLPEEDDGAGDDTGKSKRSSWGGCCRV
ncbi:hypothetical protein FRC04_003694 [Tulasnella sp. 424]|nr:hypothetical protein FRC04_003694 [Tulasnella sp. 424]KAG8977027.1 hypothetical protein FRC05_002546 [Tulasnella sp. 425]